MKTQTEWVTKILFLHQREIAEESTIAAASMYYKNAKKLKEKERLKGDTLPEGWNYDFTSVTVSIKPVFEAFEY